MLIMASQFYPGATYILSIFYTRKGKIPFLVLTRLKTDFSISSEVATRIAILYCAQILATGVSGLIAAGVFHGLDGAKGLSGWRW